MKIAPAPARGRTACRAPSRSAASTASTAGTRAVVGAAARRRARSDGRHVRPASPHRARQPGRPPDDARTASGARREAGRRDDARRRLHPGAPAARPGGVRGALPAGDRSRGRRRRGGLPLRGAPLGRPRAARAARLRGVRRVRQVEGVSSTAIRAALAEGDVVAAAEMLGRPFELDGTVVAGAPARRDARLPDREPRPRARSRVPALRDLRRCSTRASGGDLDRHESALRRPRAADRAVPPRLRRRPLRPPARRRGVGASARRGGLRLGGGARRPDRAGRRGDARRPAAGCVERSSSFRRVAQQNGQPLIQARGLVKTLRRARRRGRRSTSTCSAARRSASSARTAPGRRRRCA